MKKHDELFERTETKQARMYIESKVLKKLAHNLYRVAVDEDIKNMMYYYEDFKNEGSKENLEDFITEWAKFNREHNNKAEMKI